MLHVNPLLCPIAALGDALLAQHHIWKRLEPRLERRKLWWNMHVFCSLHGRNLRGPLSRDVVDHDVKTDNDLREPASESVSTIAQPVTSESRPSDSESIILPTDDL